MHHVQSWPCRDRVIVTFRLESRSLTSTRENKTFVGGEEYLKQRGIEVVVLDNDECKELMAKFMQNNPAEWYAFLTTILLLELTRTQERGHWRDVMIHLVYNFGW